MTTLEDIIGFIMGDLDILERGYQNNRAITGDDSPPWHEFAFVIEFFDDNGDYAGSFGRLFDPSGTSYPMTANIPNELEKLIQNYERSLRPPSGEVMKRMLIQYNRNTGQVRAEYEYDDETRWDITPANIEEASAALRPVWE